MYKCARKPQGHVCVCVSVCVEPNSTKSHVFSGQEWKKLSETLSPVSNCYCQERFQESNSESYENNVIFLWVSCPSSNTKGPSNPSPARDYSNREGMRGKQSSLRTQSTVFMPLTACGTASNINKPYSNWKSGVSDTYSIFKTWI